MGKDIQLERARTLILNEGDRVRYKGVDWYYLRQMGGAVGRAVKLLEKNKQLVRWSQQTPDVVRFV
jgi:hypothetical protein